MIERLIHRLEEARASLAREALARPAARDQFEYGRVCGFDAGLAHAQQLVIELLRDDRDAERRL